MPLTPHQPRKPIHTRAIECKGYQRDDGLWDIEAHLVDTKTYDFANRDRGDIKAGEPLHEMWLRLTLDLDLKVHDSASYLGTTPDIAWPEIHGLWPGRASVPEYYDVVWLDQ